MHRRHLSEPLTTTTLALAKEKSVYPSPLPVKSMRHGRPEESTCSTLAQGHHERQEGQILTSIVHQRQLQGCQGIADAFVVGDRACRRCAHRRSCLVGECRHTGPERVVTQTPGLALVAVFQTLASPCLTPLPFVLGCIEIAKVEIMEDQKR